MSDITSASQTTSADDGKNTGQAPGAATPAASPAAEEKRFTQAELDDHITQRLAREKTTNDAKLKREREQAAEAERIKAGEFQTVAEERLRRAETAETELTTLRELHQQLVEQIRKETQAEARTLPEELRAMMPEGDDVLAQRQWLEKAKKAAEKLGVQRSPGTPAGPRGNGNSQIVVNGAATPNVVVSTDSGF